MKVVYSPNKTFTLSGVILRYLKKHFNLTANEARVLERHDDRLIQAVEYMEEQMPGFSSLEIENINENTYEIFGKGMFKESLVTGQKSNAGLTRMQLEALKLPQPVELSSAALHRPFVYDRAFGVFYVPAGSHSLVMSTLVFLHLKTFTADQLEKHIKECYPDRKISISEFYLRNFSGTGYKSSASTKFTLANIDKLTPLEYECLTKIGFDEL